MLTTNLFSLLSFCLHSKNITKINKTIILPCSVWVQNLVSHTKGRMMMVFKNRVLRRISGPKGEEVVGGWRRLHNDELHNLYASPNIIRSRGII